MMLMGVSPVIVTPICCTLDLKASSGWLDQHLILLMKACAASDAVLALMIIVTVSSPRRDLMDVRAAASLSLQAVTRATED
jgi:hypothetical protein